MQGKGVNSQEFYYVIEINVCTFSSGVTAKMPAVYIRLVSDHIWNMEQVVKYCTDVKLVFI